MKSGESDWYCPSADLAHEVHAHRVAAEREEESVAERQDARVAPREVERERDDRVAHDLADEGHPERGDVERARRWNEEIQYREYEKGDQAANPDRRQPLTP